MPVCGINDDQHHGIHLLPAPAAADGAGHLVNEAARRLEADWPVFIAL